MKVTVKSIGSATIINAMAIGSGSAFGIDLDLIAKANFSDCGIHCSSNLGVNPYLMDISVKNVLNYYNKYHSLELANFNVDDSLKNILANFKLASGDGIAIDTVSNIPLGSGLSSSSALSNAVTMAAANLISKEFSLNQLTDEEIINLAVNSSLEAGVTITGSFDDATASYYGGVTVTDNLNRKIIVHENMEEKDILVFMPNKESLSGSVNVERLKLLSPLVQMAYDKALDGDYYTALNLNGLLYGTTLKFDNQIAIEALAGGAIASGLSGSGSSFVAIVEEDCIDDVKDNWAQFEGKIIQTTVNNEGTKII